MKKEEFVDILMKFLIVLALVVGLISLTMNLTSMFLERKNQPELVDANQNEPYVAPQEEASVINVLVSGLADYGTLAPEEKDYSIRLIDVKNLASNYDIRAFSQKTLIGNEVPTAFGDTVVGAGFNAVALANADSLKLGKEGVDTSLDYWLNSGIHVAGTNQSTDQQNLIRPFEVNDISVVFLSFTDVLNDTLPEHERYLVNVYDEEKTPLIVADAAWQCDVVIVSMYWQGENKGMPTERQRQIAKSLADAGASVIMGNAENAIQPVEWIDDTLVFYSLGNLVSDSKEEEERLGAVGAVTITKTTLYDYYKKIELTNPRVEFLYSVINPDGSTISKPFNLFNEGDLENADAIYEEYKGVVHKLDDSIRIGGLQ